jgi:hypothetical protein
LLVVCPQCTKVYHIDPAELPAAKMVDRKKNGKGWYLSCQYCFHQWFYKAHSGFSWFDGSPPASGFGKTVVKTYPKFSDKTDLYNLHSEQIAVEEDRYNKQQMQKSYSPFFDKWDYKKDIVEEIGEKVEGSILYKSLFFFLISLIGFSAFYLLNPFFSDSRSSFVEESLALKVPDAQKYFLQMKVKDIHFETFEKEGKFFVKVQGVIINPLQTIEILPPLKISVLTACDGNSIAKNIKNGQPYCVLKSWEHQFDDPSIAENSQKEFSSTIEIASSESPIIKAEAIFS